MEKYFKGILLVIALGLQTISFSQQKFTLSGYIRDSLSSESIIGATLSVNGKGRGVNSNQYGFYSITLPEGEYELYVTHIGYNSQPLKINLAQNLQFNILLTPKATV